MIFVTVGTHEQPFNRLVKCIDELCGSGVVEETVIVQTGFSTYEPQNCQWSRYFSYQDMVKNVAEARIVVTHGGPSSFFMPLQIGKIPVVVPRRKQFGEHVNDHQVDYCNAVAKRQGNIIVVESIGELGDVVRRYDEIVKSMPDTMKSNNTKFCEKFRQIVEELMRG